MSGPAGIVLNVPNRERLQNAVLNIQLNFTANKCIVQERNGTNTAKNSEGNHHGLLGVR